MDNLRKIQCGGLFITQYETLTSIENPLRLLKDHMSKNGFNYNPKFFMSDKDDAQIGAFVLVFPDSDPWLCTVHANRAWFRSIPRLCNNKKQKDEVFQLLGSMMYVRDKDTCNNLEKKILRVASRQLKDYLKNEWFSCKEQWCFAWRVGVFSNRIYDNNAVESFNKYVRMLVFMLYKWLEVIESFVACTSI